MSEKEHWETIYKTKTVDRVSWYQVYPTVSMALIQRCKLGTDSALIDVGGGASVLVDALLDAGMQRISVLDISSKALNVAKQRLADRAAMVEWLEGDITQVELPAHSFDLWHDRAVFHFMTQPEQRRAYLATLHHAVKPDGHVIIAAFAPDGPQQCSGLDVVRYSAASLSAEIGSAFRLIDTVTEAHQTPFDTTQQFVYCRFVCT